MLALIQNAIQNHQTLTIDYYPGIRVVEPHCLGIGSEGQYLLRAFQTTGASESGEHVNWKLLRLDRLRVAKLAGQSFSGPRPKYNPSDTAMKRGIIARL